MRPSLLWLFLLAIASSPTFGQMSPEPDIPPESATPQESEADEPEVNPAPERSPTIVG